MDKPVKFETAKLLEEKGYISVLPTDKPSRVHFDNKLFISPNYQSSKTINSIVEGRNLFITSNEEIKEGNYCTDGIGVCCLEWKTATHYKLKELNEIKPISWLKGLERIILTTDTELIANGIQAINDEFLKWFVKNPSCEEVEIKLNNFGECHMRGNNCDCYDISDQSLCELHYPNYKIIIPKEEPEQEEFRFKNRQMGAAGFVGNKIVENMISKFKQETLEEAAKNITKKYINEREKQTAYLEFIEGAKWQQEQDKNKFSEEDMINFSEWVTIMYPNQRKLLTTSDKKGFYTTKELLAKWVEQFKKE